MLGTLCGGRYTIIRTIGAGGFGQTYLAEDSQHSTARQCVIKQFRPTTTDAKMLEVARRLFDTEARILEQLGEHDQIPALYDFFEENQEFYLVQEFIDGNSLADEISPDVPFTETEAIALLDDVLQILEFVHGRHVIHRDIKPGNLIRRKRDGKMVLIDFGAVKELNTQFVDQSTRSSFTVGIGTQGYTPPEQLSGKPRYASDLYALGITVIQALTGQSPSQFQADSRSGEIAWHDQAVVSPAFAMILDRMVRFNASQRYASASDVRRSLQQMANLPTSLTHLSPSMLIPESILRNEQITEPPFPRLVKGRLGVGLAIAAAMTVTGLLLGIRQLGWLQPLELKTYDQMTRLRASAPPDPRLLIVEITEADLQALQRPTPSDETLVQVIDELQQYNPSVIGLDLYRDLPQEPGTTELREKLLDADNIVAITKIGESAADSIPPPPNMPSDRVGFNDIPIDPDGIVRRSLLMASTDAGVFYSFSLQVALQYLADQGVLPQNSADHPDTLQLATKPFWSLKTTDGGYQTIDAAGYQIMLGYRSDGEPAQTVSLSDVLAGTVDPTWVRGNVVLIGTTAPSAKDLFNTPYSAQSDRQMAGVIIHGQMVSQILSVTEAQDQLIWFFPDWLEVVWIGAWALLGAGLAWFLRHPVVLAVGSLTVIVILGGVTLILFINRGWVPVVAPIAAFLMADIAVALCRTYLVEKQQDALTDFLLPQKQTAWSPEDETRV
ncbi:MAG: CHASE2 domain-containing protein [Synechococcales cyanobacterium T60_A2020_003]|nr:CHASE2 domain-containing protein [Synechococcales cyanobacterium T60_A2020_003]